MSARRLAASLVAVFLTTVAFAKEIANPEYQTWADFKAGSWVTLETDSEIGGTRSESSTTTKLLEIVADKAVIEATTTMTIGGKPTQIPSLKREIAAKVTAPEGDAKADKSLEGDESLDVDGTSLRCHWVQTHTDAGGTKTDTRVWYCDEVPGHLVKLTSKIDGTTKGTTSVIATKWEKK